jgi:hypothetical protein
VVEVEGADDVAQTRQRQLLDAPGQVLDLVGRPHRIRHHEVDDGVDLHGDVVASDDRLRLDLRDLLAQIDGGADRVEEGHDHVQPGVSALVEAAEALDQLDLLLRDDLDGFRQHDQGEEDDDPEQDGRGIRHDAPFR